MKWIAIWLLLTGAYLAGWALTGWFLQAPPAIDRETLAYALAVPLAQTAALRGLSAFRRMFRQD